MRLRHAVLLAAAVAALATGLFLRGGKLPRPAPASSAIRLDIDAGVGPVRALLPLPDGALIVAGSSNWNFRPVPVIARLDAAGHPDPAFGSGGFAMPPPQHPALPYGGAFQRALRLSDGRVAAAGFAYASNQLTYRRNCVLLGIVTSDGRPDAVFDRGYTCHVADGADATQQLVGFNPDLGFAADAQDRLYVAGPAYGGKRGIVRYTARGERDWDYGVDGVVAMPDAMHAASVAVDAHGRLVALVADDLDQAYKFTSHLRRFLDNGAPDVAFGDRGTAALPEAVYNVWPVSVELDAQQHILVGSVGDHNITLCANRATRYSPDGRLERSVASTACGARSAVASARMLGATTLADGSIAIVAELGAPARDRRNQTVPRIGVSRTPADTPAYAPLAFIQPQARDAEAWAPLALARDGDELLVVGRLDRPNHAAACTFLVRLPATAPRSGTIAPALECP